MDENYRFAAYVYLSHTHKIYKDYKEKLYVEYMGNIFDENDNFGSFADQNTLIPLNEKELDKLRQDQRHEGAGKYENHLLYLKMK